MKKSIIAIIALVIAMFLALVAVIFLYGRISSDDSGEKTCIGLILPGKKDGGGWSQSHYDALTSLEEEMNLRVIYRENVGESAEEFLPVIEEMAGEGASIICVAGWQYSESLLSVNENYPDIVFLHCSGTTDEGNVSTFFGKMYQARYLTGIAAGLRTASNHIGYVAAMRTDEVIRGINAFTLGVRSVNPDATVHVAWTNSWNDGVLEEKQTNRLIDEYGADVVTYHQNTAFVCEVAERRGVYSIGYHFDQTERFPHYYLTTAKWNWAGFYRSRIRECIQGSFSGGDYWEGYSEGMVEVSELTENNAEGAAAAVAEAAQRLRDGDWDVFVGPIRDNRGEIRLPEGERMSDDTLLRNFDWFVEGVDEIEG